MCVNYNLSAVKSLFMRSPCVPDNPFLHRSLAKEPGDLVTVMSFIQMTPEEAQSWKPKATLLSDNNSKAGFICLCPNGVIPAAPLWASSPDLRRRARLRQRNFYSDRFCPKGKKLSKLGLW